jgi:hypothetical protein
MEVIWIGLNHVETKQFTNCMESPNVTNFAYKGKKAGTTLKQNQQYAHHW